MKASSLLRAQSQEPAFGVKGEPEEGGAREAKDEEQASWADGYKQ